MNHQEARQILAAWTPMAGEADAETAAALKLAREDPELQEWLKAHLSFQEATRRSLRALNPPPDLALKILAARKIARPVQWRSWLLPLAAAAAALVAGFFFFQGRTPGFDRPDFATFRSRMVGAVLREYRMDIVTENLDQIRGYLAQHGAPADFALTPALSKLKPVGGGLLRWQGEPVSMVCLEQRDLGMFYLFIAPTSSFQGPVPTETTASTVKHLGTVGWSEGGRTFLVATTASLDDLQRYF